MCSVGSKKLVSAALSKRKETAGTLLSGVRSVNKFGPIKNNMVTNVTVQPPIEPYFYDAA